MDYITVYEGGEGYYEEKKSRFIANVRHVTTEEEAEAFLQEIRKKYYDASHSCYAYTLGKKQETVKCSDAGEPSGTAGQPILSVLSGQKITDAIIVVTRYFGGTLLGTGGLVRSYTKAAQDGIEQSVIVHKYTAELLKIVTDYNGIGKLQYFFGQEGLNPTDQSFTEVVTVMLPVPEERTEAVMKKITDLTNGKAVITKEKQLFYGMVGKEAVLFED